MFIYFAPIYLNLALIADSKFGQWDRDRDTLILGPLKES